MPANKTVSARLPSLSIGQQFPALICGWSTLVHVARDLLASIQLGLGGRLSVAAYLKSVSQKLSFAAFALDDPVPGLLELPSTFFRILARRLFPSGGHYPRATRRRAPGR
jgi:predicted ATP-grasp superfamily ATP-dependent carboligase